MIQNQAPSADSASNTNGAVMHRHSTNHVLMVKPVGFGFNPETAVDNAHMQNVTPAEKEGTMRFDLLMTCATHCCCTLPDSLVAATVEKEAIAEFERLHAALTNAGVKARSLGIRSDMHASKFP